MKRLTLALLLCYSSYSMACKLSVTNDQIAFSKDCNSSELTLDSELREIQINIEQMIAMGGKDTDGTDGTDSLINILDVDFSKINQFINQKAYFEIFNESESIGKLYEKSVLKLMKLFFLRNEMFNEVALTLKEEYLNNYDVKVFLQDLADYNTAMVSYYDQYHWDIGNDPSELENDDFLSNFNEFYKFIYEFSSKGRYYKNGTKYLKDLHEKELIQLIKTIGSKPDRQYIRLSNFYKSHMTFNPFRTLYPKNISYKPIELSKVTTLYHAMFRYAGGKKKLIKDVLSNILDKYNYCDESISHIEVVSSPNFTFQDVCTVVEK